MTELNEMDRLATGLRDKIEAVFGDRAGSISISNVVDVPAHQMFTLTFLAYDYFGVRFNYENSLCGFSVDFNDQFGTSLSKKKYDYSEIEDWDSYLQEIMSAIELRIPDKFLKAKGWL